MSIIKHVALQKIVAYDFQYDPRIIPTFGLCIIKVVLFYKMLQMEVAGHTDIGISYANSFLQ